MGPVISNLVAAWAGRADAPAWRVVDPWPVEWRVRVSPMSPVCFVRALLIILGYRLGGRLGLLHLHMTNRGSVARKGMMTWLGWLLGVPVIVHLQGSGIDKGFERLPGFAQALLRCTLRRARFVVVLGRYWRDFAVDRVGVDPERVAIIPNGVPDPGSPPVRPNGGPCQLLFLGRLGERKGTPEVLEALAEPRLAALDWTITFAGDGDVDLMSRRAAELGLGDRSSFLGWVDGARVRHLLAESEVLVLPSHAEGLPVAVLEAMAAGLAIVTTPVGAIEDAITSGENGLLVPVGDTEALADAIASLILQPELRRRLQQAARERFARDFIVEVFADRFLELYRACGIETAPLGSEALRSRRDR